MYIEYYHIPRKIGSKKRVSNRYIFSFTSIVLKGKEGTEMPTWMNNVLKKMTADDTEVNVKIFITKLIVNVPKVGVYKSLFQYAVSLYILKYSHLYIF